MQNRDPGSEVRPGKQLEDVINRLVRAKPGAEALREVLGMAVGDAHADFGTVQQYDSTEDCLKIVASCGFTDQALDLFQIVRRDTNSTCAATLRQRMRTVVGNIAASYLFVGRSELGALQRAGVAAAHSAPIIVENGRLWGVFTVHFREPWRHADYDPAPMERVAARFAEHLKESPTTDLSRLEPFKDGHLHARRR